MYNPKLSFKKALWSLGETAVAVAGGAVLTWLATPGVLEKVFAEHPAMLIYIPIIAALVRALRDGWQHKEG